MPKIASNENIMIKNIRYILPPKKREKEKEGEQDNEEMKKTK